MTDRNVEAAEAATLATALARHSDGTMLLNEIEALVAGREDAPG